MFNVSWGMCLVLFVMVRLAGANAFGSNRLQRYAYFSEWQYVDPKKILFVALTLVKQSPLPLLGILPWSYLQSLSLSQVHRQVHQKQYHDDILLLSHPSLHRYDSTQIVHSRHRSVSNFIMNLISALGAYCFFDNKPKALQDFF